MQPHPHMPLDQRSKWKIQLDLAHCHAFSYTAKAGQERASHASVRSSHPALAGRPAAFLYRFSKYVVELPHPNKHLHGCGVVSATKPKKEKKKKEVFKKEMESSSALELYFLWEQENLERCAIPPLSCLRLIINRNGFLAKKNYK